MFAKIMTAKKPEYRADKEEETPTTDIVDMENVDLHDPAVKLKGSKFRMINEELYTNSCDENLEYLSKNPHVYDEYHEGYRYQVQRWSANPIDFVGKYIIQRCCKEKKGRIPSNKKHKMGYKDKIHVVDMGCGEAKLKDLLVDADSEKFKVRCFDLVAKSPGVETANIQNIPVEAKSQDIAVICLALMGADWPLILLEANRVLRLNGYLYLAEVSARFTNPSRFNRALKSLGWWIEKEEDINKFFKIYTLKKIDHIVRFGKLSDKVNKKKPKVVPSMPSVMLKACIYKKR